MTLRDVAGDGQDERDRVLGGAGDVGGRRVDDHDAGLGGGLDVHVVQPDARSGHHAELGRARDRLRVHPGGAAHDQGVHLCEGGQELGAVGSVGVADLEIRAEHGQTGFRKLLCDEDNGLVHRLILLGYGGQ